MKKKVLRERRALEQKTGWAVTEEADGKIHVRPTINGEIIDTPVEKITSFKNGKEEVIYDTNKTKPKKASKRVKKEDK